MVLSFTNVSFAVQHKTILKNITGTFAKGKITTLVGPSGAGKTTLLKLCNGLLSPTAGTILFNNQPLAELEPTVVRKNIGIALQAAPMITGTVFDNLQLPKKLAGQQLSEQQAIERLTDVGLDASLLRQSADDLSGGQRQRVSIARTLINESQVLLLDEITSALDRTAAKEIEELIVKLNKKYGVTIIWITHNLQQAISLSDDVWVMIDGELVATGPPTILTTPSNSRVRQFIDGGLA